MHKQNIPYVAFCEFLLGRAPQHKSISWDTLNWTKQLEEFTSGRELERLSLRTMQSARMLQLH